MEPSSGQTVYRVNARPAQARPQAQARGERGPLTGEDQARQVALAMTQMNMNIPGRKKGTIIGALAGGSGGREVDSYLDERKSIDVNKSQEKLNRASLHQIYNFAGINCLKTNFFI